MIARPTGVVVVRADGSTVPCELAYLGDEEGVHTWGALAQIGPGDRVEVAVMPPQTAIRFTPGEGPWPTCMDADLGIVHEAHAFTGVLRGSHNQAICWCSGVTP